VHANTHTHTHTHTGSLGKKERKKDTSIKLHVVLDHWNWLQNFEAQNSYPTDLVEFLILLFYIDSLLDKGAVSVCIIMTYNVGILLVHSRL
jgi:hypothetical protein